MTEGVELARVCAPPFGQLHRGGGNRRAEPLSCDLAKFEAQVSRNSSAVFDKYGDFIFLVPPS